MKLGGIYALERIARDSPNDHPQVVEVLTAYVRQHATWHPDAAKPKAPTSTWRTFQGADLNGAADLQGADLTRADL